MDDTRDSKYGQTEHEDLLAVVQRARSIPHVRPRTWFRLRVFFVSMMPAFGVAVTAGGASTRVRRESGRGLRVAAIAAVAASVVLLVFGGLTLAARNSNPGDALYFMKKAREDIELAFTWGTTKKAQKYLNLADARLAEVDHLIQKNDLDPGKIQAATSDYSAKTAAVSDILARDGQLSGAGEIASHLKVVKTAEKNIERRLAATGPESVLARAGGAAVTVRDSSGRKSLAGDRSEVTGRTDENGGMSFDYTAADPAEARALEATVALDGREVSLPLYVEGQPDGVNPSASVEPQVSFLALNQPQTFKLTACGPNGKALAGTQVRLRDKTGTSLIDGSSGEVTTTTDLSGACAFTVTKTAVSPASRISASAAGGAYDFGEVIVVGGMKAPGEESTGSVAARITGASDSATSIELDNGLVRVRFDNGRPGLVASTMVQNGKPGKAGPLEDAEFSAGGTLCAGPRLVYSDKETAAYEVGYEEPGDSGYVRRVYRVALARGDTFATVNCRFESTDPAAPAAGEIEVLSLGVQPGGRFKVSGKAVQGPSGDSPVMVGFDVTNPFASAEAGGSAVVLCVPIDSDTYPDSWIVAGDHLGLCYRTSALTSGKGLTVMVGVTDSSGVSQIVELARRGVGDRFDAAADDGASEGFFVKVEPEPGALKAGKQQVRLTIYKNYEKIFETSN